MSDKDIDKIIADALLERDEYADLPIVARLMALADAALDPAHGWAADRKKLKAAEARVVELVDMHEKAMDTVVLMIRRAEAAEACVKELEGMRDD